ncbi:MAG: carboxymuconolactone decarboxylase family protein [Gammaproteobacteria bacterium]|nr:carboxymuconolactone decarboxylase family protein [Gammaproteobacteria bacterium]
MKNGYQIYDENTAPVESGKMLAMVKGHYGFIPNALGAMAVSPRILEAYMSLDSLVHNTSFSEEEQHVILLAVTREGECSYCVAAHSTFAKMGGVAEQTVSRLRNGESLGDQKLEALHRFASKLVCTNGHVDDADVDTFLAAGYTREQVLEVILIYGNKLLAIFANRIMGTDLDQALMPEQWSRVA